MRTHRIHVLTLALLISACSARVAPQRVVTQAADPVQVQDYVWEAEYDGLEDGAITELEVGAVLDQARAKWPQRWEFEAMTSSHFVRLGDAAQAQAHFERARALYAANPAVQRGSTAGATTAGVLGGLVGGLIYAAVADDAVVEFPSQPSAETWSPPLGARYAADR